MKFTISSYKSYYITNIDQTKQHYISSKQRHLDEDYELFYNFWWLEKAKNNKGICNLCKNRYYRSMEQHLLTFCIAVKKIRIYHLIQGHNVLTDIIYKKYWIHQMSFVSYTIRVLENVNIWFIYIYIYKCTDLWKLFCDANMIKDNKLTYNYKIKSTSKNYLYFINTLIGSMAHLTTILKDLYINPHQLHNKVTKINLNNIKYNEMYPHNFRNQTKINCYRNSTQINQNDLFIYTDGSYSHDNTSDGIIDAAGICI